MSFMTVQNISKTYHSESAPVTAVKDISLTIEKGEFVSIMGESGSGKSTLLAILGALTSPDSGACVVDNMDIYNLTDDQRSEFRRQYIGFVFQSFHLMPYLTVLENTMLPLVPEGKSVKGKERAISLLEELGLGDRLEHLPNKLSGGEQERVAIARALVNEPEILLADEPTGNLDSKNSASIMDRFKALNAKGATILMVTHSQECASSASRIINIQDGSLIQ